MSRIGGLSQRRLSRLAKYMECIPVRNGSLLFDIGSTDSNSYFLKTGEVLLQQNAVRYVLNAGSPAAKNRIAHQVPRQVSATATTDCEIVRVDTGRLEAMLTSTWLDFEGDAMQIATDDWVNMLLRHRLFLSLDAYALRAAIAAFECVRLPEGHRLFSQGDEGESYYLIESGAVNVLRAPDSGAAETHIATLGPGDAFGEAALLAHAPRNASIELASDAVLMRLYSEDFNKLLGRRVTPEVTPAQARELHKNHAARWVLLGPNARIENAVTESRLHIAELDSLRIESEMIDRGCPLIVCGDNETDRVIGAFLLTERGFSAHCLAGDLGPEPLHEGDHESDQRPPNEHLDLQIDLDD